MTDSASVIPFDTLSHSERTPPSQDDGQFEELIDLIDSSGKNSSLVSGLPIRAFEESNRRSDVTGKCWSQTLSACLCSMCAYMKELVNENSCQGSTESNPPPPQTTL